VATNFTEPALGTSFVGELLREAYLTHEGVKTRIGTEWIHKWIEEQVGFVGLLVPRVLSESSQGTKRLSPRQTDAALEVLKARVGT